MKHSEEIQDFLIREAGGLERAQQRFYRAKVVKLLGMGKTLGDLVKVSKIGEWDEWLFKLDLSDLANILAREQSITAQVTPSNSDKRLVSNDRFELHKSILAFLEQNPWSYKREIAQAINFDSNKLGAQLKKLRDAGKVRTEGNKVSMRYAVKSKIPAPVPPFKRKKRNP